VATGAEHHSAAGGRGREDRIVVLYDRDCGFCRWSVARLLALDGSRRFRPLALQDPEAEHLLPGMDERQRLASAHVVTPDGRVHSGGDAAAPVLERLPGGTPLSRLARVAPRVARRTYDLIAARRGFLGRRLPRRAIERATERIDAHV